MPFLNLPGEPGVKLYFEDTGGEGRPIVLIHGWPLSGAAFDGNVPALTDPDTGSSPTTVAVSGVPTSPQGIRLRHAGVRLNDPMTELDLTDAVILGFSMGGGWRYISTYGSGRLAGAVLSGSICPRCASPTTTTARCRSMVPGDGRHRRSRPRRLPEPVRHVVLHNNEG